MLTSTGSHRLAIIALAVVGACASPVNAHPVTGRVSSPTSSALVASPYAPDATSSLASFFTGTWDCDGHSARGTRIGGTIAFTPLLGNAWLSSTHDDRPPGRYHALSLWRTSPDTADRPLVGYIADSQGSMRRFVSSTTWPSEWTNGRLVLTRDTVLASGFSERFTYARITATTFSVTWDVTRDGKATWRMGDTQTCTRRTS